MRALFPSALVVALVGWGHLPAVRAVVVLALVVVAVCTLEASPRSDPFEKSEGGR